MASAEGVIHTILKTPSQNSNVHLNCLQEWPLQKFFKSLKRKNGNQLWNSGSNSLKYSRCCPLSIKRSSCLVRGPIITGPTQKGNFACSSWEQVRARPGSLSYNNYFVYLNLISTCTSLPYLYFQRNGSYSFPFILTFHINN